MYLSISYFSSPPKIQHILKQNLNSTCTTRCNVIFLNNIYFSKLMSLFVNSMYMSEGTAIVLFSKDIYMVSGICRERCSMLEQWDVTELYPSGGRRVNYPLLVVWRLSTTGNWWLQDIALTLNTGDSHARRYKEFY